MCITPQGFRAARYQDLHLAVSIENPRQILVIISRAHAWGFPQGLLISGLSFQQFGQAGQGHYGHVFVAATSGLPVFLNLPDMGWLDIWDNYYPQAVHRRIRLFTGHTRN